MNRRVTKIVRCEKCGMEEEAVLREESANISVNGCLTDNDIRQLITAETERPQSFKYCNSCEALTLTTTIAFMGVAV